MQVTVTNISKCFIIKKMISHFMLKLPTNEVVFYPSKVIKELDDKTLQITCPPNTKFKVNKARQEEGKWIRYDHKTLDSADLVFIILENDTGAKKC